MIIISSIHRLAKIFRNSHILYTIDKRNVKWEMEYVKSLSEGNNIGVNGRAVDTPPPFNCDRLSPTFYFTKFEINRVQYNLRK